MKKPPKEDGRGRSETEGDDEEDGRGDDEREEEEEEDEEVEKGKRIKNEQGRCRLLFESVEKVETIVKSK